MTTLEQAAMNNEILRVTPDGEFIWHPDADNMIATGDFTASPAMPHILKALRSALEVHDPLAEHYTKLNQHCAMLENKLAAMEARMEPTDSDKRNAAINNRLYELAGLKAAPVEQREVTKVEDQILRGALRRAGKVVTAAPVEQQSEYCYTRKDMQRAIDAAREDARVKRIHMQMDGYQVALNIIEERFGDVVVAPVGQEKT